MRCAVFPPSSTTLNSFRSVQSSISRSNCRINAMSEDHQHISPWYDQLKESLKRNDKARESRYFQIATVDESGRPCNRTVVYRGFLQRGGGVDQNTLTFVTDRRSSKVAHLAREPHAEIAWYFPVTREQYRISGTVQVVQDGDADMARAREIAWKNMSDPGRQQFLWPHPGLERSGADEEQYTTKKYPGKDSPVAPDFCLCCVHALRVDHLSLKSNERFEYSRTDISEHAWSSARVNP